jgi:hypothetical protein
VKNTGKSAEVAFTDAMELTKRWVHRFRDMKDVRGLNRGKSLAMFPCPSDYLIGGSEGLFLAEVKSTHNQTSFPFADIRPAQRAAAAHAASRGFPFYFFILNMNDGEWYTMSATQFIEDMRAGRKSRPFKEMNPCSLMSWSMLNPPAPPLSTTQP